MSELKNRLEAILFASGKGVTENDLVEHTSSKLKEVKKAMAELQEDYLQRDTSLSIVETDDKWKLTVKGKYTSDIYKIVSETELPRPVLKTLAVVAYKSPVLQADIIHMRGQGAYEHIKVLNKQKLITKDEEGRSYILKITDKFYNYFDVEGDEDIKEMFEKLRKSHEEKLGELEITNTSQEEIEKDNAEKIGNLDVVDVDPITSQRSEEELAEEDDFLKRTEENILNISKRIEKHNLPERHSHPELEKEQQTIDDTTTSIQEVQESMKKEKEEDQREKDIIADQTNNSLDAIETFISKEKNKKEDEEDFL